MIQPGITPNNEDEEPREQHQMKMTVMMLKKKHLKQTKMTPYYTSMYMQRNIRYDVQAMDCYSIKTSTRRISKRMNIAEQKCEADRLVL